MNTGKTDCAKIFDDWQLQEPMPTSPKQLLEMFDKLGIEYQLQHHEAVFTVAESSRIDKKLPGTPCRNLFLRDKKKNNFLLVLQNETAVDIKALPDIIGSKRLSFGSPVRLWEYLGVRPGSVCPFAIINDKNREVQPVLEKAMMEKELVTYHPLLNTMSVSITPDDLLKFFDAIGRKPVIVDLS